MRRALSIAVILVLLLSGPMVLGSRPAGFRRTQVFVQPSFQVSHFLGVLADQSDWGVGFGATQGLQFGYLGVNITLDTDYFLTTETSTPPPFNRGLQLACVQVAGRFIYPFGDFWPYLELSAARISVISNSLVEQIGPQLHFHSLGGTVGMRFVQLSPMYLELQSSWDYLIDLEDSSLFSVNLAFGVRTLL